MANTLRFALFFATFTAVYAGMHLLVYFRITQGLQLGGREAALFRWALVSAGATFYFGMFFRLYQPLYGLLRVGHVWLGVVAITFSVMAIKLAFDHLWPQHIRPLTVAGVALSLALSLLSLYNASGAPRTREISFRPERGDLSGIPADPGFVIVQVSDLHLSRLADPRWLEGVVAAANAHDPDLVVITGDVIDDHFGRLKAFVPALSKLRAKRGVWAVPGNHEHYSGLDNFYALMGASGVRVLRNETADIGPLALVGVDDEDFAVMEDYGRFMEKAAGGITKPVVVLKHRPDGFETAAKAGVAAQFSGHTHAGQIPPLDLVVQLIFRHPYGLYKEEGAYIYTTCGTGTWGPPMRLFTRSEIVKVTLLPR